MFAFGVTAEVRTELDRGGAPARAACEGCGCGSASRAPRAAHRHVLVDEGKGAVPAPDWLEHHTSPRLAFTRRSRSPAGSDGRRCDALAPFRRGSGACAAAISPLDGSRPLPLREARKRRDARGRASDGCSASALYVPIRHQRLGRQTRRPVFHVLKGADAVDPEVEAHVRAPERRPRRIPRRSLDWPCFTDRRCRAFGRPSLGGRPGNAAES